GSDFPVRSRAEIMARFNSDVEFIRVDRRIDTGAPRSSHTRCVERFHLLDNHFLNPRTAPFSGLRATTERLLRSLPRARYTKIPLYHGAQWWTLTRDCIDYLVSFLDRNRDFLRFHRYTFCPDEIVFQSIVKCSPFAAKISQDFEAA